MEIEPAWYRISIKALISNEVWDLLLVREKTGVWDFPWWWLDHGESYDTCLRREIREEMWCEITSISPLPKYFITAYKEESKTRPWIANVFYEVEVKDLHFTPSNECSEIWFFDMNTLKKLNTLVNVREFIRVVEEKVHPSSDISRTFL